MKKILGVLLLFCVIGSVANAAVVWNDNVAYTGNWSEVKWTDSGDANEPPRYFAHPGAGVNGATSTYLGAGDVTVNVSNAASGMLLISRAGATSGTTSTLNIGSGASLTVSKNTGELVSVCYDPCSSGTVNQTGGSVKIGRIDTAGTGELRLAHVYNQYCVATYNLSGGTLDVEILNRGGTAASNATFNATGGTLAVRTSIIKWGLVSGGNPGFHLGGATLSPDGDGTAGSMLTGNSSNAMDFIMDDDSVNSKVSKVLFDLGDGDADPNYVGLTDKIVSWGNVTLNGELQVNLMGTYKVGDKWDVLAIEATKRATYAIAGSFDTLPANIQANILDMDGDTRLDTLQLEYIPEPATIALLGLGLLAIRRKK